MIDPDNAIALSLDPDQREHYDRLRAMTNDELRFHLATVRPSAAAAFALYQLDRIVGYRALIDERNAKVASNGVDVSDQAAEKVTHNVSGLRATVLIEIARLRTATSDDVEASLGMKHQTCSTRFQELRESGYIERCDEKRPTRAGNPAWPHKLTDDGWRKVHELQDAGHEAALALDHATTPRLFSAD